MVIPDRLMPGKSARAWAMPMTRASPKRRPSSCRVCLPHLTGESLAYDLPLKGWPAAAYLLRVQVTDLANGAIAAREARFRVLAAAPSPSPPPPTR